VPNPSIVACIVSEVSAFIRTDGKTDMAMGSETLPSACYILSDESSIPFNSTSNGYKNISIAVINS